MKQESLANAKVSARQPSVKVAPNFENIWTYSSSGSSNVINLGANRKRVMQLAILVISSNFGCISYRFRDMDAW